MAPKHSPHPRWTITNLTRYNTDDLLNLVGFLERIFFPKGSTPQVYLWAENIEFVDFPNSKARARSYSYVAGTKVDEGRMYVGPRPWSPRGMRIAMADPHTLWGGGVGALAMVGQTDLTIPRDFLTQLLQRVGCRYRKAGSTNWDEVVDCFISEGHKIRVEGEITPNRVNDLRAKRLRMAFDKVENARRDATNAAEQLRRALKSLEAANKHLKGEDAGICDEVIKQTSAIFTSIGDSTHGLETHFSPASNKIQQTIIQLRRE